MSFPISGRPWPRWGSSCGGRHVPLSRIVIDTSPPARSKIDVEEVVAELVAVLDRVLAGLVAGHDDVLELVLAGLRLGQPAAQRLAHREEPAALAGDLERDAFAERLGHPHGEQRHVV